MKLIERSNPELRDVLPRGYQRLERSILSELLRLFAPLPRQLTGDAFGLIYEDFLSNFAASEGRLGGEFFTPYSIVRLIVEIIEPFHGKVYDPACGSGGMFVQCAKFVERQNKSATRELSVYGAEQKEGTVPLAKMNLALHGLSGDIRLANSYYEDPHRSVGAFDFVMANPPFNVDKVDKTRVAGDKRFDLGIPNKDNANYLWIQQFHAALGERGRAGFVMANSAADAGHSEQEIRRQLIASGSVDVMVAIGTNFFYTVVLPVTLWFLDKGKHGTERENKVLFLDARHLFRQVDRAHRDFLPEQIEFLAKCRASVPGRDGRDGGWQRHVAQRPVPGGCVRRRAGVVQGRDSRRDRDTGLEPQPGPLHRHCSGRRRRRGLRRKARRAVRGVLPPQRRGRRAAGEGRRRRSRNPRRVTTWQEVTLGDLGEVVTGGTPAARNADWFGDETPFITPTDIGSNDRRANVERWLSAAGRRGLRKKILPQGTVCFVSIGATIGKLCLTDAEAVTNQQINSIVPATDIDGRFLYYLLRHQAPRIAQMAGGAATPVINKTAFSNVSVLVPDSRAQARIGLTLGVLDDLIESNRRRVEVLEEMARAIYREWFVHFRYPGNENAALVGSAIGLVPASWNLCRLDEACSFTDGKPISKAERAGGDVIVYGANGPIGFTDRPARFEECTVMGKIGSCGSLHRSSGRCWITNNAFGVLPGLWHSRFFVWLALLEIDFRPLIGGAANPYLPRQNFGHLSVVRPPDSLVDRFHQLVEPMFDAADSLSRLIDTLMSSRDRLLPKLVTGRIDLSMLDIDALVEDSVARCRRRTRRAGWWNGLRWTRSGETFHTGMNVSARSRKVKNHTVPKRAVTPVRSPMLQAESLPSLDSRTTNSGSNTT